MLTYLLKMTIAKPYYKCICQNRKMLKEKTKCLLFSVVAAVIKTRHNKTATSHKWSLRHQAGLKMWVLHISRALLHGDVSSSRQHCRASVRLYLTAAGTLLHTALNSVLPFLLISISTFKKVCIFPVGCKFLQERTCFQWAVVSLIGLGI